MTPIETEAFNLLSQSEFYKCLNTCAAPVIRRIATQRIGAAEFAAMAPRWLYCGTENYRRLFRAAQLISASMIGKPLEKPQPMWVSLVELAAAGQRGNAAMNQRGNRWVVDGWEALFCDDDSVCLQNTLSRLRHFKISPISAHDMLTAMLADENSLTPDNSRNRIFMHMVERAFFLTP